MENIFNMLMKQRAMVAVVNLLNLILTDFLFVNSEYNINGLLYYTSFTFY